MQRSMGLAGKLAVGTAAFGMVAGVGVLYRHFFLNDPQESVSEAFVDTGLEEFQDEREEIKNRPRDARVRASGVRLRAQGRTFEQAPSVASSLAAARERSGTSSERDLRGYPGVAALDEAHQAIADSEAMLASLGAAAAGGGDGGSGATSSRRSFFGTGSGLDEDRIPKGGRGSSVVSSKGGKDLDRELSAAGERVAVQGQAPADLSVGSGLGRLKVSDGAFKDRGKQVPNEPEVEKEGEFQTTTPASKIESDEKSVRGASSQNLSGGSGGGGHSPTEGMGFLNKKQEHLNKFKKCLRNKGKKGRAACYKKYEKRMLDLQIELKNFCRKNPRSIDCRDNPEAASLAMNPDETYQNDFSPTDKKARIAKAHLDYKRCKRNVRGDTKKERQRARNACRAAYQAKVKAIKAE